MKKVLPFLVIGVLIINIFSFLPVKAESVFVKDIPVYFFRGEGCPHCAKEEIFLEKVAAEKPNVKVYDFEIWNDKSNLKLMREVGEYMQINVSGVPLTIIGDKAISGYLNDATTGQQIVHQIEQCEIKECPDVLVDMGEGGMIYREVEEVKENKIAGAEVNLPFFGKLSGGTTSLFALTTAIAFLDGFNPCAMWVLLFLITLLLGMEDKRKRWILGFAFIISSGVVYYLFLAAWLNIFLFIGMIAAIRIIIGLVAIGAGYFNLKSWYDQKTGCIAEGGEGRKKIFDKLRNIISRKNFLWSLFGIILLAAVINLVELVCSAGLPAIYTQVLAMAELSAIGYYSYLLWYIFIFMLDDLIVFIVAMVTLQAFGISSKYALYTKLIGGIIILILGILMIFKPEWLMFG
jgi:thiol-disulfide isomerase/thioredoxin